MYTKADQTSENRSPQQAHESRHTAENTRPEATVQRKLQSLANESGQVDRLQTYQLMANAHADNQQTAQLQQLAGVSGNVVQLKSIRGGGYLKGTVNYTPQVNNGSSSAFLMEARNIELKDPTVRALAGDHPPAVDPPGWGGIQGLGITKKAPFYKRMHLLNGELGGSGNDVDNLAPGSTDLNNTHSNKVEDDLHAYVLNGGKILSYNVWAYYRTSKLGRMSNATGNIYKSSLYGITCEYELDDGTNTIHRFEITEGVNTAKNWPD